MKRVLLHIILVVAMFVPIVACGQSAKIKFDNTMHDFELVPEDGGPVAHDFVFSNVGDAPLVVIEVNTNCGCTVADFPQAPVAPGKQGVISITFDPKGHPGEFAKEIVVKTNAKKKKSRLHIKGMVLPQQ
ncbi:MAG: DUF1573 domain-containing protein [Bacteroidaceae bacterium]|nr:DUF1573 domain-containing protein [Bacteroidaceae bacterium]